MPSVSSWQVDNHGVNREALIKAYDVLVKSPEDRKKLERTAPLLVAARDKAVVEQKGNGSSKSLPAAAPVKAIRCASDENRADPRWQTYARRGQA